MCLEIKARRVGLGGPWRERVVLYFPYVRGSHWSVLSMGME